MEDGKDPVKKMLKGKLIVIDGGSGSGKATQTQLLMQYLKKKQIPAKNISFPRYKKSFHGQTIARFLKGEFGKRDEISPYLTSLAFALDRLTAKKKIVQWLKAGNLIICDRYVASSFAHQGAKLPDKERYKFQSWIEQMEYKEHGMPKERLSIFLYMPAKLSQELIEKRAKTGRLKDIEEDLLFQEKVGKAYLELCKKYKHWVVIKCVDEKGKLKTKKEIHDIIIKTLKEKRIVV